MSDAAQGAGKAAVNKTDKSPVLMELMFLRLEDILILTIQVKQSHVLWRKLKWSKGKRE